jgi:hypothetical protein
MSNLDRPIDSDSQDSQEYFRFIESQTDYTNLYRAMQALAHKRGIVDDDHALSDWALA